MNNKVAVCSYPELGTLGIPLKFIFEKAKVKYLIPPQMTKRTIEIGARYSPDYVCAPFKYMLGCYIEAMEKGANVLIQTGEVCRLGYYGELHKQILKDLGYEFDFLNLTLYNCGSFIGMIRDILKYSTSKMAVLRLIVNIPATLKMIFSLDIIDDIYRRNMGFEIEEGAFDRVRNDFINDMRNAKSYRDVRCVYNNAKSRMRKIALNKPKHPVRIGVVGEYYTLIDSFSNLEFEKSLAKMGVEVNRCMNISNSLLISPIKGAFNKIKSYLKYDLKAFPTGIWAKFYQKECNDYIKYDTGSSSVYTIASAKRYAKAGFDGLIHAKTFGCMPEIDAIPVLNNISEDYKIPVLFLSFDTQTSETGIETRLEAFVDMINLKRKAAGEADF